MKCVICDQEVDIYEVSKNYGEPVCVTCLMKRMRGELDFGRIANFKIMNNQEHCEKIFGTEVTNLIQMLKKKEDGYVELIVNEKICSQILKSLYKFNNKGTEEAMQGDNK